MNRQEQEQVRREIKELEAKIKRLEEMIDDILANLKPPSVYRKRDVSRRARL